MRRIAEPSVFRKLSVKDNILAILETRAELSKSERQRRLTALLEEFHLTAIENAMGMTLSGGEHVGS